MTQWVHNGYCQHGSQHLTSNSLQILFSKLLLLAFSAFVKPTLLRCFRLNSLMRPKIGIMKSTSLVSPLSKRYFEYLQTNLLQLYEFVHRRNPLRGV